MIGFIGGSGFENFLEGKSAKLVNVITKWGLPSQPLKKISYKGFDFVFLQRHGGGKILPHKINYQANMETFYNHGVRKIIASAAVGGISFQTGAVVVPDQIIDYTYGRNQTFYENNDNVKHIDFSKPYDNELRRKLLKASKDLGVNAEEKATHGVTQGPRLETIAEIKKLKSDGCDIVGMTGMPEACLASELGIDYACLAYVVNPAAGVGNKLISIKDMQTEILNGAQKSIEIFIQFLSNENS